MWFKRKDSDCLSNDSSNNEKFKKITTFSIISVVSTDPETVLNVVQIVYSGMSVKVCFHKCVLACACALCYTRVVPSSVCVSV